MHIALTCLLLPFITAEPTTPNLDLRSSLTFHASFDHGVDADFAKGDKTLYVADQNRKNPRPGVPAGVMIARGQGRRGDALQFTQKTAEIALYQSARNLAYNSTNWGGTISFWLRVDPQKGLIPDYVDPFHVTQKSFDAGAIWFDFTKDDKPRHCRMGAFADKSVWNPKNRGFDDFAPSERSLIEVSKPPFTATEWTHITLVFANYNTNQPNGSSTLYLNAHKQGSATNHNQKFTWEPTQVPIMLGLNYTGLLDELAIFNKPLTDPEIQFLYTSGGNPITTD
jgi:hypothetical protein